MKRYLKLVNFEISRFMKIYVVLIAITVITQITGVIVLSKGYLKDAEQYLYGLPATKEQFINDYGLMSMADIVHTVWFVGPIGLCIAALIFYVFFIWYRDWFGKSTFIYRLLMLPTMRMNIFYAKATTMMLLIFGLVSIQFILVPIEGTILKWMVPKDFRMDLSVSETIGGFPDLQVLLPHSFIEFMMHYGIGMMIMFIVFTCILFERSYRLKGIFMGIVYGLVVLCIFLSPTISEIFTDVNYLYPTELFILQTFLWILVTGLSIWVSNFLLNKKINV